MRILFIGDIVGRSGRKIVLERMPKLESFLKQGFNEVSTPEQTATRFKAVWEETKP